MNYVALPLLSGWRTNGPAFELKAGGRCADPTHTRCGRRLPSPTHSVKGENVGMLTGHVKMYTDYISHLDCQKVFHQASQSRFPHSTTSKYTAWRTPLHLLSLYNKNQLLEIQFTKVLKNNHWLKKKSKTNRTILDIIVTEDLLISSLIFTHTGKCTDENAPISIRKGFMITYLKRPK